MCVCVGQDMSPVKTAELIKMPFQMWTWVNQRIHVLDGASVLTGMGNFGDCPNIFLAAVLG